MYPDSLTRMIIQSSDGRHRRAQGLSASRRGQDESLDREHVKDQFKFVDSMAVTLKAGKVLELAKQYQGPDDFE